MGASLPPVESRVAVLVDCDNTRPEILDYALRVVAQFGRVVLRRGYGNHSTLTKTWQEALVRQAFTPCLQFQYASGKNTADIALALDALEAMFDDRADKFCLVTSDSDCVFRGSWTRVSREGGQVFRAKLDSRSAATQGFSVFTLPAGFRSN
ncbi:NYN domain-containing protein [Burkholderia sp. WP9]|uniref:NYN domain-containing protein n=1 Tax=Burkholderia sp. WP9 TaxID=1500263 RepID=UPI000894FC24|nr:NYN domain-containing protein [Burkholderia sp. WP9]SED73598.1 NYN domain-containing protein [Burkholderia sp. WP9]